jgi:hypothetical protein
MKKNLVLMILILFAFGCAAGRTQIVQPKKRGFKDYPILEITDFKNYVGSEVPPEISQRVPDSIAKKVAALNFFQAVNRIPVVTEWKSETNTLVIEGTIIEYDPGSQAKRYLAGFTGYGKGFVTVQYIAIDKATKEEIFKANVGSEISGGFFGGSFDEAVEKLVEEAVECIQTNY